MARGGDLRLGIDVGGTNTDAVVLDAAGRVLAKAKVPTTPEATDGIRAAIATVLAFPGAAGRVAHVMVGTTHATNAVIERRGLRRVAAIRIGAPATTSIPPLATWPRDSRAAVVVDTTVVRGGSEYDGKDLVPLDEDEIARFLEPLAGRVDAVAITSVFSPVRGSHEERARHVVERVLGAVPVSLSSEIGSVGLLERENATALNAALGGVVESLGEAVELVLGEHAINASAFLTQNDGTLMSLDYAQRYPVLTIGGGPANSMRGAAYLTGLETAVVADVGGTSTDLGMLVDGFPRASPVAVEIGGIRTNFRMPDLVTMPLGGGTVIGEDGDGVVVGPRSVGYRITEDALLFGGKVATLSDAAVASGWTMLAGASTRPAGRPLFTEALGVTVRRITEGIDRVKSSRERATLVVVGGASFLVPDGLPGVSETHRPTQHDVANAIGAAIAPVSGQIDRLFPLEASGREAALDVARSLAAEEAVRAGADPNRVDLVALEDVPLGYLDRPVLRVRAKAAGPLASPP